MDPTVALASLLQLRRPHTLEQERAERMYAAEVREVLERIRQTYDDWAALREVELDNARLANAAAVHRWALMRLAARVNELSPPRSLTTVQRDLYGAVLTCARACQLLANGYRFHKSEAVCDGQALLVETVEAVGSLLTPSG